MVKKTKAPQARRGGGGAGNRPAAGATARERAGAARGAGEKSAPGRPSARKAAAKKTTAKKTTTRKASAKKTSAKKAVTKKAATKKTTAKKTPAKKAATKKTTAKKTTTKKAATKKTTAKKAATKKAPAKKAATRKTTAKKATAKKAPAKKAAAKKASRAGKRTLAKTGTANNGAAGRAAPAAKARRSRRMTRMTVQEALISLATLQDRWPQLEWLDAIVLYGPQLRAGDSFREFSFLVIHHGLTTPSQARAARAELDALLATAVPIKRRIHLVREPELLDRLRQEDPAVEALLGQPIPIWVR